LLMACATVIDTVPHKGGFEIQIERRLLRVIEEKVFAQLDEEASRDESLRYLNSRGDEPYV
jgi:hypothetical protein